MSPITRVLTSCGLALAVCAGIAGQHFTGANMPQEDLATSVKDRRGTELPTDLEFVDENGQTVRLGQYFTGDRPVILNLGYLGCPSLCGVVTQGMVNALGELTLEPGRDFEVVTISIHPDEKPPLARAKKNAYLAVYTAPGAGSHWHFLTGEERNLRKLADSVGFSYQWNPGVRQYDHGAALFIASPNGVLAQTLEGAYYDRRTLRLALVEASDGKIGTAWDRILLNCYGYDPTEQRYTLLVWTVVRIAGAVTIVAVAAMIFWLWRRERRRKGAPARAPAHEPQTV